MSNAMNCIRAPSRNAAGFADCTGVWVTIGRPYRRRARRPPATPPIMRIPALQSGAWSRLLRSGSRCAPGRSPRLDGLAVSICGARSVRLGGTRAAIRGRPGAALHWRQRRQRLALQQLAQDQIGSAGEQHHARVAAVAQDAPRVENRGIRLLEGTRSMGRAQCELFDAAQGQLWGRVGKLLRDEIEQRIRYGREERRGSAPGFQVGTQQAASNVALKGRKGQQSGIDRAPRAPRSFHRRAELNSGAARRCLEAGTLRVDPGFGQLLIFIDHRPW